MQGFKTGSRCFSDRITGNSHVPGNATHGVYCPNNPDSSNVLPPTHNESVFADHFNFTDPGPSSTFDYYWNPPTVACYLTIFMLPLISMRSITFFTKFNSLGEF